MREWNNFVYYCQRDVDRLEKKVALDNNYIETANEKGRKEENISKRKIQLTKHKLDLENAIRTFELVEILNDAIRNNNYKTLFLKHTNGSAYKYRLDVIFLFENIDGYTGVL